MAFEFYLADTLQRWGFMDFILPFVLVFTIVFAVLQKVKIFGKEDEARKFNVIISVVMGLAFVVPHALGMYPRDRDPVTIILNAIPNVGVVLVAVLMGLLIIGLLGKRFEIGGSGSSWFVVIAFVIVGYIFGNAAGWWQSPVWLSFISIKILLHSL